MPFCFLRALIVAGAFVSALPQPAASGPRERELEPLIDAGDMELITIMKAVEVAQSRFMGRVIDAQIKPGRPHERAAAVYELRMLTERGNVLRIRLDALTGDFLEVEGRGLTEARRRR